MTGKKKPTVLFVDYFSGLGGGQAVLLSLLSGLKARFNVSVLLFTKGPLEAELKKMKVPVHYVATPEKVRYRYFTAFARFEKQLKQALDAVKPDLVYCNGFLSVKLCAPLCSRMGLALIWHKHLIPEKGYFSYSAFQIRRAASLCRKIICVSEASRLAMIKSGVPGEKITVVYNGLKTDDKKAKKLKLPFGSAKKMFVFGAMGYLRRNKGFDMYIQAAAKLVKDAPDAYFVLAGRGEGADRENENMLRALAAENNLGSRFYFAGFTDKDSLYASVDCFVMPSPNEPFGMVTLEAQAKGIIVAGFGTGGTGEIVKDNITGYLTGNVSSDGLYEVMRKAYLNKRSAKQMSSAARRLARERFPVSRQIKEIAALIEGAL